MGNELTINFAKKKNFSKDGIEFKFGKETLTIIYGSFKNNVRFSKNNITYGKELLPIIDPRKYNSEKTIVLDFDGLKKLMDDKLKIKRDKENLKNAAKAKEMLLNVYVGGALRNLGIDEIDETSNLRRWFLIDEYSFVFNYNDEEFVNLDFEDLEIDCCNEQKMKFSKFLETIAPKIKRCSDAKEEADKLEQELSELFFGDDFEDCDDED